MFFRGSSGVIGSIIKAIDLNKEVSLSLVARIESFILSNEEIAELIRLLNKKDPEESDQVMNRYLHIQQCLLHFPVNVPITKNSFGLVKTCPMPWIKR